MYLSPFSYIPLDGAIPDVAVSSVGGRWLRTHVIRNGYRLAGALCHFVDAGNITGLYADAAGAHASGELAVIPPANVDEKFVKEHRADRDLASRLRAVVQCMSFKASFLKCVTKIKREGKSYLSNYYHDRFLSLRI